MAIAAPEIDPRIAAQALKSEAYLSAVISQHEAELEGRELDFSGDDDDNDVEDVGVAVIQKTSRGEEVEVGTSSSSRRDSGMEEQSAGGSSVQNADPPPYAVYSDLLDEVPAAQQSNTTSGREKAPAVNKTSSMKNGVLAHKTNGSTNNSTKSVKGDGSSTVLLRHSSVPRNGNRVQRYSSGAQSVDRKLRKAAENIGLYGIPRHSGSLSEKSGNVEKKKGIEKREVPDDDPPAYSDFRNGLQENPTVALTDL